VCVGQLNNTIRWHYYESLAKIWKILSS